MRISTRGPAPRNSISVLVLIVVLTPSPHAWAVPMVIPHSSPVWTASGQQGADREFGASVAVAGDVNGDGFDDVLVGSPGWGPNLNGQGRAVLYLGSSTGLATTPAWTLQGELGGGALGVAVSSAGDFNGDGFDDVMIAEPGYGGPDGGGRVRVFFGARRGVRQGPAWGVVGTESAALGNIVAFAGDVNGDGAGDILIGTRTATWLFLGHSGRPGERPDWTGPPSPVVAGIGDINGDGFDDVALETDAGTEVYLGSSTGLGTTSSWTGPKAISLSGRGDVNGDGIADLLLGPPDITARRVQLFLGSPRGLGPTPRWQVTSDGGYFFGISVSLEGDVNSDGHADIAIATPAGVQVYLSELGAPSYQPDWRGDLAQYPYISVVALGDVNGDGSSEVLTSNPNVIVNGQYGQAYLYQLGPAYPAPAIMHEAPATLIAPSSPLPLQALVMDWTHSVARVEIHYRYVEDFDFQPPITMQMTDWDRYAGTIPGTTGYSAGFVYFIRAYDDYGLASETEQVGVDYDYGQIARVGALEARVLSAPGGSATEIAFTTTRSGSAALRVFDVAGRLVATLLREASLATGEHHVPVGGSLGTRNGVFFYRLETAEGVRSGRLIRLPGGE
ncbi:MAG: FG-GAP-like repeat-containing protein [Bacteroidota bacterium]